MHPILIIGGSDAGISAALRIHELEPGRAVSVVLSDGYPNWSVCGLTYFLGGETPDWRALAHRTAFPGITVLRHHHVDRIEPVAKRAHVVTPAGQDSLPYEHLIIATGALPIVPDIPGKDLPCVHLLHTMGDALAVDQWLRKTPAPRRVVVVGAGYIGLEVAEAFVLRGLEVTVMSRGSPPFPTVDPCFGGALGAELERHGVKFILGSAIEAIEPAEPAGSVTVRGSGGVSAPADLVLLAIGVRPNAALAAAAGIELGAKGAIRVDRTMKTSTPGIWAAGDCVETWHHMLQRNVHIPLGTTSHKQGRIAGESALGGERLFAGVLGTQVVKVFDLAVARTGLLEREAKAAGFDPLTSGTELWDHKSYYPGASKLRIRILGDRGTRKLLGAQILGPYRSGAAKRIDVFAAALFHGMTVEELSDLDLSYAPPFSSPWDPVQAAAQAWLSLNGTV